MSNARLSADSPQADAQAEPQATPALLPRRDDSASTDLAAGSPKALSTASANAAPSPELLADAACAPYAALQDQPLLDALYDATRGHTVLGYAIARDHMYGRREPVIDIFDGKVECVYTGRLATPDGTRTPEDMNTEHAWPRSKGSRDDPALSDLHHLFITDRGANQRRSNYEFGWATCNADDDAQCRWEGGDDAEPSSVVGRDARGELVFEVRPQRRGDIARSQFYFSTRYRLPIGPHTEAALRAWHAEDPPDARERERNTRIEAVQGNRNPFVDCPALVERVRDF